MEYEFSNIDATPKHVRTPENIDDFNLFEFSAKWDPVPTMLTQNHETRIKGFMGQTTAFNKEFIKPEVLIMGENKALNSAKYIHGKFGKDNGHFTVATTQRIINILLEILQPIWIYILIRLAIVWS